MYFPFIRGKQFDLIALKESTNTIIENGKILPIIEPVNLKNYVLRSFERFIETNMPFILIINPTEGSLINRRDSIKTEIIENIIDEYDNFYVGFIITSRSTIKDVTDFLEEYSNNKVCFIHYTPFQNVDNLINKINEYNNIVYQIFYDGHLNAGYISRFVDNNKVLLKDEFSKENRNADYTQEEYYSNLYKEYRNRGFIGFGDFSIIGDYYIESAGPANAVAIHYTYINEQDDDNLWIKHFVSDDTEGPENILGKFSQALGKYVNFLNGYTPGHAEQCSGCSDFLDLYGRSHFPGLASVKKISLKHHIKLISELIS